MTVTNTIERGQKPAPDQITGVRKIIFERSAEVGVTLATYPVRVAASRYIHQYVNKGSPKRLDERDRGIVARMLHISENYLRDTPPPIFDRSAPLLDGITQQDSRFLAKSKTAPGAGVGGRRVPLFSETEEIDPAKARRWAPPVKYRLWPRHGSHLD